MAVDKAVLGSAFVQSGQTQSEKTGFASTTTEQPPNEYADAAIPADQVQAGDVRYALDRKDRLILLICIWITTFVLGLSMQTMYPLLPYVYSSFQAHSLMPTAFIVSSVVGAVIRLPLAKVLDLWGRAQGLAIALGLFTIGCIAMAASQNVVTYAAAMVLYITGYDAFSYVLFVLIADHWNLKDRGLIFGFYQTPWIATTYIGPVLAERFLSFSTGWRWSFGVFAIASPLVGAFMVAFLARKQKQAMRQSSPSRDAPFLSKLKHYLVQIDVLGLFLLASGFSLFLLSLSFHTTAGKGFESPSIISMLVIGIVLMICFGVWEKYFASVTLIPFALVKDRTIIGASLVYATTYMMYQVWSPYLSSSIQVVQDLNVVHAGYIYNIHSIGWCIASFAGGAIIKFTGWYKGLALFFAIPLQILNTGLMIYFSKTTTATGLIVMSQIFIALADGLLYVTSDVALLSNVTPQHFAIILAVYNLTGSCFQAIGSTISIGLWTSIFPEALLRNLPADALQNMELIYADITTQLSYQVGTPVRQAIQLSYEQAMSKLFITATPLAVLMVVGAALWKKRTL